MTRNVRAHKAEVLIEAHADVAESPVWDPRKSLWTYVDITAKTVNHVTCDGIPVRSISVPQHVGAALPADDGTWLLAMRDSFAILDETGAVMPLLKVLQDSDVRFNDAKCDPLGRAFAGTMPYDSQAGRGALFRLDDGPTATTILSETTLSNGLGWNPAGDTMYFVDSGSRQLRSFDFDLATGSLTNGRPFVHIPAASGMPDGLCVDDDGGVWVALFGGSSIHRYTAEGDLDAVVTLPVSQPTSCAIGGNDGRQLFITTASYRLSQHQLRQEPLAGAIFSVTLDRGAPPAALWKPIKRTKDEGAS